MNYDMKLELVRSLSSGSGKPSGSIRPFIIGCIVFSVIAFVVGVGPFFLGLR